MNVAYHRKTFEFGLFLVLFLNGCFSFYFLNSVGVIGFFVTWVFYMDVADKPFDLHAMLW